MADKAGESMKITAAQAVLKMIELNGTETVFGYPGAAASPLYRALKKESLRHVLARTEQGAAHMAVGYWRATGKTGVCLATSGPGSTNLLTAVANAYMDSVPLVAITAQVAVSRIGTDAFQEVDTTGITAPVTKHNYLIKKAEELPRIIHEAFYLAKTGRPGSVVIDIPVDVLQQKIEWQEPPQPRPLGFCLPPEPEGETLTRLVQMLEQAERPLLIVGGGVVSSGAQRTVAAFLKETHVPSVSTMMGLSALPDGFPGFLGMVGIHGTIAANKACSCADLIIFVGSRITERTVPEPMVLKAHAKTVHIDIDPAEINKNCPCDLAVCGDVQAVFEKMIRLAARYQTAASWQQEIRELSAAPQEKTGSRFGFVEPQLLLSALRRRLTEPTVLATEVGQHQIWVSRFFGLGEGDILLTSGGFGTMGFGLPAAIGAKIARPEKTVIAFEGDGSLQMSMAELATMQENKAPVKMIVFKNNSLGLVRELDKAGSRAAHVYLSDYPDFCKLAAAYSIPSLRLSENSEIDRALTVFLREERAFLLEVVTDPLAHT